MRLRPTLLWDRLRTNFWFVPTLMAAGGLGLAFGTVAVDTYAPDPWVSNLEWVYRGGPEGAAGVLSSIAGSMATLAGLVFSLTLVALTLASSQFGPRLLRNFMRDRLTQVVLGTFLAAFLYCLFVLRTIRREDGSEFVPHLAVTLGVVLAVGSLVMLIVFIHHLATLIQADTMVSRVASDLNETIDHLYPEEIGSGEPPPPDPPPPPGEPAVVAAARDGYIQEVDADALLSAAERHDVVVELVRRPGHYLITGTPVARVWPADRATDDLARGIFEAITWGSSRTPVQDVEFSINQLVEVAARALSPGINDPYTAIACVNRLGSGLARLAHRRLPSAFRRGEDGKLRVIAYPIPFPDALDAAFNQIRQFGKSYAAVMIRLLEVLADLAGVVPLPEHRAAVLRHAEMVSRATQDALTEESDKRDVAARFIAVQRALGPEPVRRPTR